MKKIVLIVLCTMALLASCKHDGGEDIVYSPTPAGVYIAGQFAKGNAMQACYWAGNRRTALNGWSADSITVSNGTVLATGVYIATFTDVGGTNYDTLAFCYWVNGERHETGYLNRAVTLIDGEAHIVSIKGFNAGDVTVHNGKVYTSGTYHESASPYNSYVSYFADGIRHDIMPVEEYSSTSIAVDEDGAVYVAGVNYNYDYSNESSNIDKAWYYAGGEFIELQGFTLFNDYYFIRRVQIHSGKVYVFAGYSNEYFIDGEKVALNLPDDAVVSDYYITKGGVMYMVGYYERGNKYQACYWIDGERFDLSGSMALSIYVEE